MKTLTLTILVLFTSQVYAGDLIILGRYYLEKSESAAANLGIEREPENKENTEGREKRVVRGKETDIDTQAETRNRNINNYVIRKSKHKIENTKDRPFLEYQF